MGWDKYNTFSRFLNVFSDRSSRTISVRNSFQINNRRDRNNRYRQNYHNKLYNYITVLILSISSPVVASTEPETTNVSNPVAAATGNVTNQAVQFQNNGAPSRQYYGPNSSCNGSTMTFSPFYMGNDTDPEADESYVISENWGFQLNFMIPLDRKGLKQCRTIAKRHDQKLRLEYELTRAIKCAELQQKGFTLRPNSRIEFMCNDIVPIVSLIPKEELNE